MRHDRTFPRKRYVREILHKEFPRKRYGCGCRVHSALGRGTVRGMCVRFRDTMACINIQATLLSCCGRQ
jgi:hypothetical protein